MQIESVADVRLATRAINEDWPVTPEMKASLVEQMYLIANSGVPDLAIPAAKFLLSADALNAKKREADRKRLEAEHARKLQLIELAHKLGLVGNVGGAVAGLDSQSSGQQ